MSIYGFFPALKHRNFKLFWIGQIISLVGTWMQNAALGWLVYLITKDRLLLGVMTAVQFTPLLIFSLFAGIIIEKYPKRRIIILTQTLQLITALLLFLLVFTNHIKYSFVLIIVFIIGTVQSIDNPARQSFVVEMVESKNNLMNAIALNSAAFNGARLIGPAVAGIIMANLGPKWCFFLNAVSFLAVIAGLLMMKMEDKPSRRGIGNPLKDIGEGLKYISQTPKLLFTLISVIVIPTFCINFNVLLPPFTKDVLNLGEQGYGNLMSALGFGALIGAVVIATQGSKRKSFLYQAGGAFGLSLFLILMGFTQRYGLSLIVLALCGFFMVIYSTTCNSVLQMNSPDNMRGRIMSVYSLIFGGLTPIGSLYSGGTAKLIGIQGAFILSGGIGILGFLILMFKRRELK